MNISLTVDEEKAMQYVPHPPALVTDHLLSTMSKENPNCPIRRQFIPTLDELKVQPIEAVNKYDEKLVAPRLAQLYHNRAILYLTDRCLANCRFCRRKKSIKIESDITESEFKEALNYIKHNEDIREIIISGGEPLSLPVDFLEYVLSKLKENKQIEIIRIETRLLSVSPQMVNEELCSMLSKFGPMYIVVHVNHPKEITREFRIARDSLMKSGLFLASTSVLLKGINDKSIILVNLFNELVKLGIRPYYLYQCDFAPGNEHFRVPIHTAIRLMYFLRNLCSGLAVPNFIVNLPNGGGKVLLNPDYVISKTKDCVVFKNYRGEICTYYEKVPEEMAFKV